MKTPETKQTISCETSLTVKIGGQTLTLSRVEATALFEMLKKELGVMDTAPTFPRPYLPIDWDRVKPYFPEKPYPYKPIDIWCGLSAFPKDYDQ